MKAAAAWALGAAALALGGDLALLRWDIAQRRAAFEAEARIAHRQLSQRAAQHEAILATLVLLAPAAEPAGAPEQRLPALVPQLLRVMRREGAAAWGDAALDAAEARSRSTRHAEIASVDAAAGRYTLVQAGSPVSFALLIDAARSVPWDDWPVARGGPVSVRLVLGGSTLVLQPGAAPGDEPAGLTAGFRFADTLATAGQPFELQLRRATGPAEWPWGRLAAWALAMAALAAAGTAWQRARRERGLAEARLRLAQTARLSALGEMAAGIAHELNQPLAAVSANAQAARRLLDDDPPELEEARAALAAAAAQARRAAEVVARLRRRIEQPGEAAALQPVDLREAARQAMALLEPERRARAVSLHFEGQAPAALADPVALQQLLHNLASNALAALEAVPETAGRAIVVELGGSEGRSTVALRDNGPGMSAEALARATEPFYTTRAGGLGLGLALCESLALAMQGQLTLAPAKGGGLRAELALRAAVDPDS